MGLDCLIIITIILPIYKQKDRTHFDDILFDNTNKLLMFGVMLN